MTLSGKAQEILPKINETPVKMGTIKKVGKEIKRDHDLAMELWATGEYTPRLLAVLIMDKKLLTQDMIDGLADDMLSHNFDQRNQLADWLLANQLMKSKKTIALIESWEHHPSPILQRLFWYHQARLRWTGQTPPANTPALMDSLEKNMATAAPEVQWAMNYSAAQIGIFDPDYRTRCIDLGEKLGLYKDDPVAKNCTPSYLPEFIRIEVAKRDK